MGDAGGNVCQLCNDEGTPENPAFLLQELGLGPAQPDRFLLICRDCLARREVVSWSSKREIGHEIARALADHPGKHGHYTYLEDPNFIHLVRLRSGWVTQHVTVA